MSSLSGRRSVVALLAAAGGVLILGLGSAGDRAQADPMLLRDGKTDSTRAPRTRLFGTFGLGFINTRRDVGADIPLGAALLLERYRLLLTANVPDMALINRTDDNGRFVRLYPGYCTDTSTYRPVPDYYCSGNTDLVPSASVDLSYIILNEVWFSDKAGKVSLGMGYRFRHPEAPYATLGVFFPSRGSSSGAGARLDMGPDYIHMGITWALDLGRFVGR